MLVLVELLIDYGVTESLTLFCYFDDKFRDLGQSKDNMEMTLCCRFLRYSNKLTEERIN